MFQLVLLVLVVHLVEHTLWKSNKFWKAPQKLNFHFHLPLWFSCICSGPSPAGSWLDGSASCGLESVVFTADGPSQALNLRVGESLQSR